MLPKKRKNDVWGLGVVPKGFVVSVIEQFLYIGNPRNTDNVYPKPDIELSGFSTNEDGWLNLKPAVSLL